MIRLGILGPSEIAFRRFMPALKKAGKSFQFAGIGIASPVEWFGDISKVADEGINEQQALEKAKAAKFTDQYGGNVFVGYKALISSPDIDAVYIPLPPALHFKWAKMALEEGKHVFVEKPSTTCLTDTEELIRIASEKGLALHENYMFIYHNQIEALSDVVRTGEIGDVRLYRITFGFPRRSVDDFRYNRILGGGALLDAGGYCLKYANFLLGGHAYVTNAQANYIDDFQVDMYGSATLANKEGQIAQIAFGMDNDYRCEIDIWGSLGTIMSNRILTAPDGYTPTYTVKKNQVFKTMNLSADDAFFKSIQRFMKCIEDPNFRKNEYRFLTTQANLVDEFRELAMS
jgi:predicted dehydrogenase